MFPVSRSNLTVIIGSVCGAFFLLCLSILFFYFFKVYIVPRRRINYNFVDNPIINNPVNVSDPNNFVNTTSSVFNPFVTESGCAVEDTENVSEMTDLHMDSVLDSVQDFHSVIVTQNVRPVLNASFIANENEDVFTDVPI